MEHAGRSKSKTCTDDLEGVQPVSRMESYGLEGQFKLLHAAPTVSGRRDPNPRVQCGLCGIEFSGGTTRQRQHLLRNRGRGVMICTAIESKAPALLAKLQHEQAEEQRRKQLQSDRRRAAASASSSCSQPAKQQKLSDGFAKMNQSLVDAKVAAFFYAEGIPFGKVDGAAEYSSDLHLTISCSMQARSRYFKQMLEAVAAYGSGYQPPGSDQLRTRLLVEAVDQVEGELAGLETCAEHYGSAITSDGWSDACMRPILNMLQVFPTGAKFLDSIDTSGDAKARA